MRILYVEDNEVNRALVERVMRARQCSVVFQDEGEGALAALAADPTIDLILLDIELAGTMTGLDVIRTLRARNDHRPVVAVTAYAMMGDRERILEAGCDQYLPKPLVVTDLLNVIDHYQN
jgi:two-component system cell cycle response regulator DivK